MDSCHQQYEALLGYLFETEQFERNIVAIGTEHLLIQHAAQLCQHYVKNLLDMQDSLQRLKQAQSRESNLGGKLENVLETLQRLSQSGEPGQDIWHDAGVADPLKQLACNIRHSLHEGEKIQSMLCGPVEKPATAAVSGHEGAAVDSSIVLPVQTVRAMSPFQSPPTLRQEGVKLDIHLFGEFKAAMNGRQIKRWPHGKGQQIFKYLLLHRVSPVRKERLMETFWPNIDVRAARNNLNVSIYYLRQDLSRYHKTFQFVLYQDDCYLLNPELSVWVDVEAFDQAIRAAQRHLAHQETPLAISAYRDAEALYKGDCLKNETTEWALLTMQAYQARYLEILGYLADHLFAAGDYQECAELWQKAVALDSCDERAHRNIMRCYLKMGQRQLALRQYHLCVEALQRQLELEPSRQTRDLLEQIRQVQD